MIMLSHNTYLGMHVEMYLCHCFGSQRICHCDPLHLPPGSDFRLPHFCVETNKGSGVLWHMETECIAVFHLNGETCVNGIPNEETQATCLIHRYATMYTKAEGGHLEHVLWIQQYRLNESAVFGYKILGCFNKNGILHNIKNLHTKCTLDEVKEWW